MIDIIPISTARGVCSGVTFIDNIGQKRRRLLLRLGVYY